MTTKLVTDYFREIDRFIKKIKENPVPNCRSEIDFKLKLLDNLSRVELDDLEVNKNFNFNKEYGKITIERIDIFIKELKDAFCDNEKDFETWDKSISDIKKDVAKGKIFNYYPKDIKTEKDHLKLNEAILYTILNRFEYIRKIFNPPQQSKKIKPELKINQIALKYVYEGLRITRKNSTKIVKQYGYNSGEKLFQKFIYFSSLANRKGKPTPCTPKKLDNKIKLIESVIELLPMDKQERVKDEVSILKKIYDTEYQ